MYKTLGALCIEHEDGEHSITADTVIEEDKTPQWIGLYDHTGEKIYRFPVTCKLGFIK